MPLVTLTLRKGKSREFKSAILTAIRSEKVKKPILADLIAGLAKAPGLNPDNVMVVFKETSWENWAFGGGRLIDT